MRRSIRWILAAALLAGLLPSMPASAAVVGGPIVLMGIDAEDGGIGGHGPIATYVGVMSDVLANATKGSGILVLGGGKAAGDNVTSFWNAIGSGTGETVTYANGSAAGTVSFGPFKVVAIASSEYQTPGGGLTQAENDLIGVRDSDFADHVNSGGGLLGLSQDGLSPLYPYLDAIGSFDIAAGGGDSDVTTTPEGAAVGLDDASLDVCCWHDTYISFPDFLLPLARYAGTTRIGAIGGQRVVVLRKCTDAETTVSLTRPVSGRLYEDDVDLGSSGTTTADVRGATLTVEATTSAPVSQVNVLVDGTVAGTDTSAPYSVTVPVPPVLGGHSIKVVALNSDLACRGEATGSFNVVCFDAAAAITRPAPGRLYDNDVDVGSSGGPEPAVIGGLLTLNATSSKPSRTSLVTFTLDGNPVGADATAPYTAVLDSTPLGAGTHSLGASVAELVPGCGETAFVTLRRPDPAVLGVAVGLKVATDVPAEAVVTAGGAMIGGMGGSQDVRVLDRNAPNVDYVRTIVDKADGLAGATGTATSSSVVQSVSLAGGLVTADVLESHASVTVDGAAGAATTSDAGSRIVGLRVNAIPVDVSQPNTAIAVPGVGTLVLQETLPVIDGLRAELTVNALHLYLDPQYPAQEIVLGSAHAGANFIGDAFVGPASDLIHRDDDAHLGADAADDEASATPITPGLYSGSIGASGDTSDFYSFDAGQGDRIDAVVKPAERTSLHINPLPTVPSLIHERPSVTIILRDPTGAVRSTGALPLVGAEPQRVELNADTPFSPAGAKGRWTLEVQRRGGLAGFYSLELSLTPVPLREQNDADIPGDAPDNCDSPRPIALQGQANEEQDAAFAGVIREADASDFYTVNVEAGRTLTLAMKPDELADGADFDLYLYGPSTTDGAVDCDFMLASSATGDDGQKAVPEAIAYSPVVISGDYVFEIRRVNAVANYYVNVNVTNPLPTLVDNDAGTSADAGDDCASATPVGTGVYEGTLIDRPDNDVEDWYAITLAANQDLTVVMKPADIADFRLELYKPDCTQLVLTNLPNTGDVPLSVPEVIRMQDSAAGEWRIRIVRDPFAAAGNYALGVFVTP